MKVSEGFVMADSRNLPKVDYMMLLQHMRENSNYNVAEIRGAKMLMSSRDSYVESSVGFVHIKREIFCTVKGLVTPEHRVRSKPYTVVAVIDENEETIIETKCEDCAASAGGCKHSICFLMWLVRRTEEPAVTSVQCYWTRPKLAEAITKDKFVLSREMGKKRQNLSTSGGIPDLNSFVVECKTRKIKNCLLTNYQLPKETLDKYSIFDIMLRFYETQSDRTFQNLKSFAGQILTQEAINAIEESTRSQADSKLWHTMRQGRVTASKIHEATRCNTDGILVKMIMGGFKVPETQAILRGKRLEGQVRKRLEDNLRVKVRNCGFILVGPFIGASPDGETPLICDEFVIEIKCPMVERTMTNYIKDNVVRQKWKAQIQLQMHATRKQKGLFCVADPNFEKNQVIHQQWLYYDKLYVEKLIREGEEFWKNHIFCKMLDITKPL